MREAAHGANACCWKKFNEQWPVCTGFRACPSQHSHDFLQPRLHPNVRKYIMKLVSSKLPPYCGRAVGAPFHTLRGNFGKRAAARRAVFSSFSPSLIRKLLCGARPLLGARRRARHAVLVPLRRLHLKAGSRTNQLDFGPRDRSGCESHQESRAGSVVRTWPTVSRPALTVSVLAPQLSPCPCGCAWCALASRPLALRRNLRSPPAAPPASRHLPALHSRMQLEIHW